MATPTPHVLLYFDVNKTMIMHDPVQGKTLPNIVNDLLTERALGRVIDGGSEDSKWIWNGEKVLDLPSFDAPREDGLMSYGAFLRAKFSLSGDPKIAKENKHTRKVLRQDFTATGNPGEGLKSEHEELLQHLLLPRTEASETQLKELGLDESPHCFIVPAFFRFLEHLQQNEVKFNLIFRTYGDDLRRVAQEFNCFCEGRHPCFPLAKPMDGSDGGIDRRIHLDEILDGEMPRFGTFFARRGHYSFETVRVVQGLPQIHHLLTRHWRESQATLALRDFYPHWFRNKEDATAGKLLVVDPTDLADGVHAMFFDDNILPHDAHIVDARFAHNDSALSFEETRELHLMRVEPLDVIQREAYFIDRFEVSLQRRTSRIRELS